MPDETGPRRGVGGAQLGLFGLFDDIDAEAETAGRGAGRNKVLPEAVVADADLTLAQKLPPRIYFGTSSWSFPGWTGIVWQGTHSEAMLAEHGLGALSRHPLLGCVGVDRGFYTPVPAEAWRRYRAQVAPGFLLVPKAWGEVTMAVFPNHPRYGERAGRANPSFLDPTITREQIVTPYLEEMGPHAGPIVFEIPPFPATQVDARRVADALDRLFSELPSHGRYAVELRTRQLLTPRYLRVLAAHGVGHVLNYWSAMPTVGEQLTLPGILTAPFVVSRLMLPPGERYDERRAEMAPFDHIVDPQPQMREDIAALIARARAEDREVFVIVNNKAEGSAPLTIRALIERVTR